MAGDPAQLLKLQAIAQGLLRALAFGDVFYEAGIEGRPAFWPAYPPATQRHPDFGSILPPELGLIAMDHISLFQKPDIFRPVIQIYPYLIRRVMNQREKSSGRE